MSGPVGFKCTACGEWHDDLPLAYHLPAPAMWSPEVAKDPDSELGGEQCVIHGKDFFLRGLIRIPIVDAAGHFEWGVWVSLSEKNFIRTAELWELSGREREPAMFGWLSSELPVYPRSTLTLKTMVHTQPVGVRPLIELEPTDHPLAVEQREGIQMARVQELAEELLHRG